jgi:penicillin G amidase
MKNVFRYFVSVVGLIATLTTCWILDGIQFKGMPLAFGRVLDPFHGFWQNMEGPDIAWDDEELLDGLTGKVTVRYDSLRIPHIFAENDHDLYFAQGFVTARDRLFQMEFQTHAAAGRLSEIIDDPRVLAIDRARRRTGMVYAAEQSIKAMNADPVSKAMTEAYSDGVNAYINSLSYAELPMEYKLLSYRPEPWSPFKSALLLKFMAWDLTGSSDDFYATNAAAGLGSLDYERLFPDLAIATQNSPIAPHGTVWDTATVKVQAPDSFSPAGVAPTLMYPQPDPMNGSNNWVVAGSKTASGHPILCNDPHLGLRLPSIWYEIQLSTPAHNVYGVSLPGSPAVIIGFNQDISWGVTNASRDVLDWYKINFQDASRKTYRHDGQWLPTTERVEVIKRRFGPDLNDTIIFTQHGPVVYDRSYSDPDSAGPLNIAMRWAGHDSTNEVKTFYLLNRARNHDEYRAAISIYACPGQNFVFASSAGDIAITQQGRFPVKWTHQGQFVMDGSDKLHLWQAYIPASQNPYAKNPERGFLFSTNQHATDTTYPYHIYGSYDYTRNLRVSEALEGMRGIKVEDMFKLQNDNYNEFAAWALPTLLTSLQGDRLKPNAQQATAVLAKWNYMNDHDQTAPSLWQAWVMRLYDIIWEDDMLRVAHKTKSPNLFNTVYWLADSTGLAEVDDSRTPQRETIKDVATRALNEAVAELDSFSQKEQVPYTWQNYNDLKVLHLTRQKAFSFYRIPVGGGAGIVNANRNNNGASWRMVVEMGSEPNAYGVFPGGQSGNPGSYYYNRSLGDWAAGRYHKLLFLKNAQQESAALQFTQTLQSR